MFYWLIELSNTFPGFGAFRTFLNVFRYITFRTGGAVVTGALFVFLFGPWIIDHLRIRQGKGQPIRTDGPQSHLAKKGTPTMGGLMILSGLTVGTVLWANPLNPYVWIVLAVTLGFGFVGFYDDYLKVTKQTTTGFGSKLRLLIEAAIALVACYALVRLNRDPASTALTIPFLKDTVLHFGWFFVVFGAFVIVGAGNAVNLTDGLDGLAIVPVMIATASFAMIAYLAGNAVFADYLQIKYVAGTGDIFDLEVVGEHRVAGEIGDHRKARGRDHHGHDGEAVETVGEIHRIAGADDDEGAEHDEEPSEMQHGVLQERDRQRGGRGIAVQPHQRVAGHQRDRRLDQQAQLAAEAGRRLLRHLEVVVIEADEAETERHRQHDPDIGIERVGPQHRADREAGQDHQPAHGGRALLGEMRLRTIGPDRLALALADA